MTAAHCTANSSPNDINVKVGEHDLTTSNDNAKVIKVEAIHDHPDYNKNRYVRLVEPYSNFITIFITINIFSLDMDFSILKLKEELTFSNWVRPACLPKTDESTYEGVDGKICYLKECINHCETY